LLRQLIAIEPLIVLFVTIDLGDLIGKIKVGRLPPGWCSTSVTKTSQ
jgi:hypothetical protein